MSETLKDWRKEVRSIFREEAADLLKASTPKPAGEIAPSVELPPEHPTHDLKGLIECPDCYPKIKKAVIDKEILSRKDLEYECVDCGTRVDENEDSCPTCGGTEARRRRG